MPELPDVEKIFNKMAKEMALKPPVSKHAHCTRDFEFMRL